MSENETGQTPRDLVLEVFPDANDDLIHFLLWEKTAFPHADGDYIKKQLRTLKATQDAGGTPCDDCNEPATVFGKIWNYCAECDAMEKEMQAG